MWESPVWGDFQGAVESRVLSPGFPPLRHFHSSLRSSAVQVWPGFSHTLSRRHTIRPQNTESVHRRIPILYRHRPFLRGVPERQV